MTNTRRTSHRRNQIQHRPAHWDSREIREAFAFSICFEGFLKLLNFCGFEFFRWLRDAMEAELIPGVTMALIVFVAYTPASRYGLMLGASKTYLYHLGHTILQLRVEQIVKPLVGHHMRTVLLWAGGTACLHLTVGFVKTVLHHPFNPPAIVIPFLKVPVRKHPAPTHFNASDPVALMSKNDR